MLGVHQAKIKKPGCYPSSEASKKCCNVTSLEALKFDSSLWCVFPFFPNISCIIQCWFILFDICDIEFEWSLNDFSARKNEWCFKT